MKDRGKQFITDLMITFWVIWIYRNTVVFRKENLNSNEILVIIDEFRI